MGCCEATNPKMDGFVSDLDPTSPGWQPVDLVCHRRTVVRGLLAVTGGLMLASCGSGGVNTRDGRTRVRLAFCGQLLCVVPYEVARARGHFAEQGLDVELIYTRGGNAAMQALVGEAVEYAGTSFDVALQAVANGAAITRFASTGRLPLFALAVAPSKSRDITSVAGLIGHTVAVSALGNADHALLLYLLDRAGIDGRNVPVAAIGTNVFDALRLGQVDAAMVQEPALSLITEAGGRELVNFMDLDQASAHLGGPYEFMGVSVRREERDARLDEMRRLAAALAAGLRDTRAIPAADIVAALPPALISGSDRGQLEQILDRYRLSLYPDVVTIARDAAERVARSQEVAGLLTPGRVDLSALLDTAVLEG